ncbi:hypothetical protein JTE90_013590 [Oedothorax gibbosus]|uniref:Uncharacterized protein n=1 Tax=Oedothorax gibbosus TaxID=931172 RepID=A0AAV6VER2_9ARAC|nr:hypothetical protein JTE90_013590 [Oedothorax gibbosus]
MLNSTPNPHCAKRYRNSHDTSYRRRRVVSDPLQSMLRPIVQLDLLMEHGAHCKLQLSECVRELYQHGWILDSNGGDESCGFIIV